MSIPASRRPRLTLPFAILSVPDRVHLVAGEEFRYSLCGGGIEQWLPGLLDRRDGQRSMESLLHPLPPALRAEALETMERLYSERVLVGGPSSLAHPAGEYRLEVTGSGPLREGLERISRKGAVDSATDVPVLCQDRLDYREALEFNLHALQGSAPWLWASTGPMGRAFVSPLFMVDAGPCLACLVQRFEALSPAPEIYPALIAHAEAGRPIPPLPFPPEGVKMLQHLVLWKLGLLAQGEPTAALYRLHVLEADTLEISSHQVPADPECRECGRRR